MKKLYILTLFTLTSCVMPQQHLMSKPGQYVPEEQVRRDTLYCRQLGLQNVQSRGLNGNPFIEIAINSEIVECMQFLGYR